jgi:phage-related baseplate assembly protein
MAAGAARIEVTSPAYQKLDDNEVGICTKSNITFGGFV